MKDLTQEAVWEALEAGRAYVAFDWIADATGFDFAAVSDTARHEMGSQVKFAEGLHLRGQSSISVGWQVIHNGKPLANPAAAESPATESRGAKSSAAEILGRTLDIAVTEPGNYRVEAWVKLAGKKVPWILSNPIYIQR